MNRWGTSQANAGLVLRGGAGDRNDVDGEEEEEEEVAGVSENR